MQGLLAARIGRPVAFLNDADAAGVAEMTLGAGRGRGGTANSALTFGTGIGSAIFVDGRLLPNTELGHLELRGEEAEHRASAKVRTDRGLGWTEWAAAVNEVLAAYHMLLWPDLFIIGGGVTENWDYFGPLLTSRAEIVPASFRNDAGIIGSGDGGCACRLRARAGPGRHAVNPSLEARAPRPCGATASRALPVPQPVECAA